MKNLWSPWRSKYIESFKDEQSNGGCVFCEAAKQDVEDLQNLVVHKAKHTFTLLNMFPYNNGHLMIVPNRHLGELDLLSKVESIEIMDQIKLAKKALVGIYDPQGFNIGANLGRASGAGIEEHVHFHIVPRWNGDTNFMPVLGEVKIISQDLAETKKLLLATYKKLIK
jgi:ATP adenylyltransferase